MGTWLTGRSWQGLFESMATQVEEADDQSDRYFALHKPPKPPWTWDFDLRKYLAVVFNCHLSFLGDFYRTVKKKRVTLLWKCTANWFGFKQFSFTSEKPVWWFFKNWFNQHASWPISILNKAFVCVFLILRIWRFTSRSWLKC